MSVINTMLKDLEMRGAQNDLTKEDVLRGLNSGAGLVRRDGFNPYLVSLLSVLTVFIGLLIAYLYSPYRLVEADRDGVAEPQSVAVRQSAEPVPAVAMVDAAGAASAVTTDATPVEQHAARAQSREPEVELAPATPKAQHQAKAATIPQPAITPAPMQKTATMEIDNAVKRPAAEADGTNETLTGESGLIVSSEEDGSEDAIITMKQRELSNTEKSRNMYANALALFKQGEIDEARQQLKQALALDPSSSKSAQLLAAIHIGENRADIAADILDRTLQLRSSDQDLLRLYLQVQVQLKHFAQAIELMERRIRVNSPEDIAYLAGLYQKNNDHLGAVKLYAQALKLKPTHSVWWMGQGISFEALGKSDEAMKSYQQSISSGRLNTQLVEYVLGRIGRIEKAAAGSMS